MKKIMFFMFFIILTTTLFSIPNNKVSQKDLEKKYIYLSKGDKLFKQKKYKEAIKYYYAVTKLTPSDKEAWKKVGFCYYQLKLHKYAYSAFKKVLSLDKNDKDAKNFMEFYNTLIEKNKKKNEKREMIDSIWRAALLPGWGQIHNNQIVKGLIIGGGFIISLSLTVYNINDEKIKYEKYLNTNENHNLAYQKAQEAYNAAMIWGIITSVIYAGGILDAALNYNSEEAKHMTVKVKDNSIFICKNIRW